jgi:hypothetical protein
VDEDNREVERMLVEERGFLRLEDDLEDAQVLVLEPDVVVWLKVCRDDLLGSGAS